MPDREILLSIKNLTKFAAKKQKRGERWLKALGKGVVMEKIKWCNPELIDFYTQLSYGNCNDTGSYAHAATSGNPCNTHGAAADGNCLQNGSIASGDNCAAGGDAAGQCSSNGTVAGGACTSSGNYPL